MRCSGLWFSFNKWNTVNQRI